MTVLYYFIALLLILKYHNLFINFVIHEQNTQLEGGYKYNSACYQGFLNFELCFLILY